MSTMTPTTPTPTTPHRPADGVLAADKRVSAEARQAFEKALQRQGKQGGARDPADPADAPAVPDPQAGKNPVCELAALQGLPPPVFASSQPVPGVAMAADATSPGAMAGAPVSALGDARLGASLAALTMPASPLGPQHWQFSFFQDGSMLSGVALTAQPGAPWRMQLQTQGSAHESAHWRERQALDARLGDLRQRLAGRGAQIGDIALHDPWDER